MISFKERTTLLSELCQLKRQSLCFQLLTLLSLCDKKLDNDEIERCSDETGVDYYEANSLKQHLANDNAKGNMFACLAELYDANFVERMVIKNSGEVAEPDETYSRRYSKIYWRLAKRGQALMGLV